MSDSEVDIVNIVAVGDLGTEIDIEQVAQDVNAAVSNYDPDFNATYLRFEEDGDLIILYTSGKYVLRGGDNFDNMHQVHEQFLSHLTDLGLNVGTPSLDVKNIVSVGDLDRDINLEALTIGLGLEHVEYEPEQFPGVVYRRLSNNVVFLLFSSGKVVITGGKTKSENRDAFDNLKSKVEDIL